MLAEWSRDREGEGPRGGVLRSHLRSGRWRSPLPGNWFTAEPRSLTAAGRASVFSLEGTGLQAAEQRSRLRQERVRKAWAGRVPVKPGT